jgi:hypothetical protein
MNAKIAPLVSIIILNLNRKDYLEKCLQSIYNNSYKNCEVIVVDNGSTDGSQELVRKKFPYVKLIENSQNLGFGGGNNIGIKNARGDLLFLINNDVVLDHLCIQKLVEKSLLRKDVGIFGCKIYFGHLGNVLQHAGGILDKSGSGTVRGLLEKDSGFYDIDCEVDWVHGAAMMVRREVFEKVGIFDRIYHPIYHDEIDICYRARKAGFKVLYVPKAVVYHYEEAKGLKTLKTAFLRIRNQFIFVFKFYNIRDLLKVPFYEMKMVLSRSRSPKYRAFSVDQRVKMLLAFVRAFLWVIGNLDVVLAHRYNSKKVTNI